MTVATKIEAPVKFLYTAPPTLDGTPRSYPFSVLGLGDVVIPGLFVRFMGKVDEVLKPSQFSYFGAATIAYAIGEYCSFQHVTSIMCFRLHSLKILLLKASSLQC